MKLNEEKKKYIFIGLILFAVIACSMLFYYFLFHFEQVTSTFTSILKVLMPFIDGLVIAYLLSPIIDYIETKIEKVDKYSPKTKSKIRGVNCFIVILSCILIIYGFLYSIIPEIRISIKNISDNYPTYEKNVNDFFVNIANEHPEFEAIYNQNIVEINKKVDSLIEEKILPGITDSLGTITSGIVGAVRAILNLLIGIIIAFYTMYNKEKFSGQCKKMCYAIMRRNTANGFIHNMRFTSKTFQNFIVGKLCDSIIIGLICFIAMVFLGLKEYALLVSVIIGVTNMIPLFGPFIGAIPSAILLFMDSPKSALVFIIMIIILQQFDGNILGPKILGSTTGLSGFWVIFAITIFGGWLGVLGWLVGVPIFAVIYSAIKAYVNTKLTEKGLSTNTEKYITVNYIDDNHHYIKIPKEEVKELSNFKDSSILSFISSKFIKDSESDSSTEKTEDKSQPITSSKTEPAQTTTIENQNIKTIDFK